MKSKKKTDGPTPDSVPSPLNDELGGGPNLTAIRDQETLPVAREILRIIGEHSSDVPMGTEFEEADAVKYYQALYVEIMPYVIKANLRVDDITFLIQTLLQPLQLLQSTIIASFESNRDIADAKLWGVRDLNDIRVQDLDRVLRSPGDKGE